MKRKAFLLILAVFVLTFVLAIGTYAADIKIEADELSDIHSAVSSAEAGDYITVDLTADIIIPKTSDAIKLTKDITLEINCNNHIIVATHGGGGAGSVYGMYLNSFGARLILNGSLDKVDYVNYVEPTDEKITVSNGVINNPNIGKDTIYPDYAAHGPAIVIYSGSVELNNMYINQYDGGEWAIFMLPNAGSNVDVVNNLSANNCIVRSVSNRYCALGTRQGNSRIVESLVQIENSVIYGTGNEEWLSMGADSYVKNTRIAKNVFKIDSYMRDGYAREGHEAVLQNVIFENKLTSNTGAIYVKMIDCQFTNGMNIYVTGDSQGKTVFTAIESATCTKPGRQASIECYKGGGKTITSFDQLTLDTEADLSPLGHTADPNKTGDIHYDSYLESGMLAVCIRCGTVMADENIKAAPLFTFLGFSTPEDGSYGIVASYIVNVKAIEQYEEKTGKVLSYGIVAGAKSLLGDKNPLDKDGNKVTLEKGSAIKAEITREYASYDFILKGMNENQLDTELVIATYVEITEKDGENVTKSVVYLQSTQKTENLSVISYNTIPKEDK